MKGTQTTNPPSYLIPLVFALCLALGGSSTAQPVSKQPAWVFPIYFEEGGGQRDTLYLCYDSSATINEDPEFGDSLVPIDTTIFNAVFDWAGSTMGIKKQVKPLLGDPTDSAEAISFNFGFTSGVMPLKIKWDGNLFYSDSLPFPDNDPLPRAQGELGQGIGAEDNVGCGFENLMLMSDTADEWVCYLRDSVIFTDFFGKPDAPVQFYGIYIRRWQGRAFGTGTQNAEPFQNQWLIFPNPANGTVTIRQSRYRRYMYRITDVLGKEWLGLTDGTPHTEYVQTATWPAGVYIVQLFEETSMVTLKILVK